MFIGRGLRLPLALEGALKLKEISYIHAEAYPAGELKHGPIALLDERVPLVAMALASRTYDKVVSNIQEVRARGARVLALATEGDEHITRHAEDVLYVPAAPEMLSPLLAVLPLQLLSYHVALARGCNIDQPRNLAKSSLSNNTRFAYTRFAYTRSLSLVRLRPIGSGRATLVMPSQKVTLYC